MAPLPIPSDDRYNLERHFENGIEALRGQARENLTATARGGPDNSAVTERGIRGLFYSALELQGTSAWAQAIGLYMPSNTRTERHRHTGQVPEPRKHYGGLNAQPLNDFSQDITNEDLEITLPFSTHDLAWDQIGHLSRRSAELAMSWTDNWNKLTLDQMAANTLAYDGVAMFSASHAIGSSGAMSNLLTSSDLPSLNVSAPTRPTKAEAGAILADLSAYMYRYVDDVGRPTNQMAKRFLLVCHPAVVPGFRAAIRDLLYITGGTNELSNLGVTFEVVGEPRLTSLSEIFLFRTDGIGSKPMILQEAQAPTLRYVGPDSEHAIKNNEVLFVSKAIRAVAPGEFRHMIKATMS